MAIEEREEAAMRAAEALKGWETASPEERLRMLERAGDAEASRWEVPAPETVAEHFEEERLAGVYDNEDSRIHLNERLFESENPAGALNAWTHEYEHARQRYEVSELHGPAAGDIEDQELAREFEANAEEYVPPEQDEDAYWAQPLETDAREFAARETRDILDRI